jgi:hypothetical protein
MSFKNAQGCMQNAGNGFYCNLSSLDLYHKDGDEFVNIIWVITDETWV